MNAADRQRLYSVRRDDPRQRCHGSSAPHGLHGTLSNNGPWLTCLYCGRRIMTHPTSGGYQLNEIVIDEDPY